MERILLAIIIWAVCLPFFMILSTPIIIVWAGIKRGNYVVNAKALYKKVFEKWYAFKEHILNAA